MPASVSSIELLPIPGLGEITADADIAELICSALAHAGGPLRPADIVVIAQKIVSKAEGRIVPLASIQASPRAVELAATCGKDPRLVELVLRESAAVVRCAPGVLITRHRLGFTVANAGIDQSNLPRGEEHVLLLPQDPDGSAHRIQRELSLRAGGAVGVIINDSFGRPWRRGTCGVAVGCAGVAALLDLRGRLDRSGRPLRTTEVAQADEIAAAASLVMGQADEGIPAVVVRGVQCVTQTSTAAELIRPEHENLFK